MVAALSAEPSRLRDDFPVTCLSNCPPSRKHALMCLLAAVTIVTLPIGQCTPIANSLSIVSFCMTSSSSLMMEFMCGSRKGFPCTSWKTNTKTTIFSLCTHIELQAVKT